MWSIFYCSIILNIIVCVYLRCGFILLVTLQTVIMGYQMPITVPGDIKINKYPVADFKDLIV